MEKVCTDCKETKPLTEFYAADYGKRLSAKCKICTKRITTAYAKANRDKRSAAHKKRLAARPDHIKEHKLKYRYGLLRGGYMELLEKQEFGCAICGDVEMPDKNGKPMRFHVDHCHGTKQVRGILCRSCNNGIGHFRDDPDLLRAAAEYLEERRALNTQQSVPTEPSDCSVEQS